MHNGAREDSLQCRENKKAACRMSTGRGQCCAPAMVNLATTGRLQRDFANTGDMHRKGMRRAELVLSVRFCAPSE